MGSVLITGGNGFLGEILKKRLGCVISLGRNARNELLCDLSNQIPVFQDSPEVVIHAAGQAHSNPRTEAEVKMFYDVNFEGTKNLCLGIDKLETKPKSFIFISTVAVYGLDEGENIKEDYPLLGKTPYAKSKILAENFLMEWAKKNNIILAILRLPLIAGPNPPGNLGAMIKGIKSGRYLSIGNADAKKSIVWADDIVGIIPKLCELGGVYNLTDRHHPSFKELENVISTKLGKGKPVGIPLFFAKILGLTGDLLGARFPINSDKLKKITSSLTFDDSKAFDKLGWCPSSVLYELNKNL